MVWQGIIPCHFFLPFLLPNTTRHLEQRGKGCLSMLETCPPPSWTRRNKITYFMGRCRDVSKGNHYKEQANNNGVSQELASRPKRASACWGVELSVVLISFLQRAERGEWKGLDGEIPGILDKKKSLKEEMMAYRCEITITSHTEFKEKHPPAQKNNQHVMVASVKGQNLASWCAIFRSVALFSEISKSEGATPLFLQ